MERDLRGKEENEPEGMEVVDNIIYNSDLIQKCGRKRRRKSELVKYNS